MDKEKYFSIGKLVGTHALKGEMVLRHGLGKATTLRGLKCMFIQDKTGSFLPWFIEGTRPKNETNNVVDRITGFSISSIFNNMNSGTTSASGLINNLSGNLPSNNTLLDYDSLRTSYGY